MIVIIDYGMGNVGSILNMIRSIGADAIISSNVSEIRKAKKIILPGVGAFDHAIQNLNNLNLVKILNEMVIDKKTPILGICLGMQLLTKRSEEGKLKGLGWIDAETIRFKSDKKSSLKIPHMGWNEVEIKQESPLFRDMYAEPKFYFVHSYYIKCNNVNNVLTTTPYGIDFASSIMKGNIFGVQFHPEKSHKFGMKLLKNFAELT